MQTIIQYRDKKIDLKPYFEGFPYFGFIFSELDNTLYYMHRTERITLKALPLTPQPDLAKGRTISDLDFGAFNAWSIEYLPSRKCLWYIGDERNDEILNIYFLSIEDGQRAKMTDEEYVYGADAVDDGRSIVFIARRKDETAGRMVSTLKSLDVETGTVTSLISDDAVWTFSWTSILQHRRDGRLVFRVMQEYDRNRSNIVVYDPATGLMERLLPPDVKRTSFGLLQHWLDDDTFLYISDESGFINVYAYHLPSRTVRAVTAWTEETGSALTFPVDGRALLWAVRQNPVRNTVMVIDPRTSETLYEEVIDGSFSVFSHEQKRLFSGYTSCSEPFQIFELVPRLSDGRVTVARSSFLRYPEDLLEQVVQGTAEAIEYETFDTDPKTQSRRRIHSFLLVPHGLPEDRSKWRAIITAFYGGENRYRPDYQILLQAGFIVLSPAVRGSWGFGADFYALNDRDLGGNEIIDLVYAGRYLTRRFGIEEHQIGLQGGSHGGYCALRAATYPSGVNGHNETFGWGFAISAYGISNIVDYYRTCNIPDWVLQKAGNPDTERERLMDRSPVMHADKATGPILLVHGENDNRVPVDQSRQMARALADAGKPFRYVELPGQGHGWRGLAENLRYYSAVFDFFNGLDQA